MASREEIIAQKEKTSQALVQAALELCAETGFASLSLRSVARRAGIAPTSFYRHFRDIDELGISMALDAGKIMDECLGKISKHLGLAVLPKLDAMKDIQSAVEAFVAPFVKMCMEYFKTDHQLLRLFFQERTGSSKALRLAIAAEMEKLKVFLSEDLENFSRCIDKPLGEIQLLAETLLLIIMAGGMEKMLNMAGSDEMISKAMRSKLSLILIGALTSAVPAKNNRKKPA